MTTDGIEGGVGGLGASTESSQEPSRGRSQRVGVVRKDGFVAVRRGEVIVPLAGTEADVDQIEEDTYTAITYHLPVEVEIVGEARAQEREAIIQETCRRLRQAFEGRLT